MSYRFTFVLIVAALGCAPAALAQSAAPPAARDAPSTTVAPVTVQAAAKPKVIEKQTHTFVQSYAAAPNAEIDQIGRWHAPVCPEVLGLIPDQAEKIKARIESVAQALGLQAARKGCAANIEIVFTDQPQHTMDIVAQRREYLLGYYHRHDHDRLKTVTHPIQAWYVTATRGGAADSAGFLFGVPGATSATPMFQTDPVVIDDPDNQPPAGCSSSPHFTACLKSEFQNVFMVADSKVLQGKDLGVIADYMVMLALSQPRSLDGCSALPSVIDLFSKAACPDSDASDGLTPADAAYLTALYSADLQAKKAGEQTDIANRMAKILIKANAASAK